MEDFPSNWLLHLLWLFFILWLNPWQMHIDFTDRRTNSSSVGSSYFLTSALLDVNYSTHNSIHATFHLFSQIHLLQNKAKMTALSPENWGAERLSHLLLHMADSIVAQLWFSEYLDYTNLASRGICPLHIRMGLLLWYECMASLSSSNVLNHIVVTVAGEWRWCKRCKRVQLSQQFESFKEK